MTKTADRKNMIPVLLGLLAAMFVAVVLLTTRPGTASTASSDPVARLTQINELVMDRNRSFSISATLAELDALEPRLPSGDEAARGRLAYLRGFVLFRAGRAEESLSAAAVALRIDEATAFLSAHERSRFLYNVATQAEDMGRWATAIDAYREAVDHFDADPSVTRDQRLGTRERLAFCLHEAGRHAEAMAVNREVLAGGESLFGPDSDKLLTVVTNLAQNAHALGEPAEARIFLDRRLDIATRHGVQDHIDEALFQLGVLAYETGDAGEAESFMKRRLELAEASGNRSRIADAREDLDELYRKLGR